jgi:hypothetical protein
MTDRGERVFSHKLPVEARTLRAGDKRMFQEGFYVESREELLMLAEDFSS